MARAGMRYTRQLRLPPRVLSDLVGRPPARPLVRPSVRPPMHHPRRKGARILRALHVKKTSPNP